MKENKLHILFSLEQTRDFFRSYLNENSFFMLLSPIFPSLSLNTILWSLVLILTGVSIQYISGDLNKKLTYRLLK